jgi:rare lipoprotein A
MTRGHLFTMHALRHITIPLLLVWLFGVTACSGPVVLSTTHKKRIGAPAKRVSAQSMVPATQRPYIIKGKKYYPLPSSEGYLENGIASWYGRPFHGRRTSNGETYDMFSLTAAHKTLPMGTQLLVHNLENGREIVVRVHDRGPFVKGRIIDLSLTGAKKLDIKKQGTARIRLTALGEAVSYRQGKATVQRFLPHQDFNKGEFFVQIGSFSQAANAESLLRKVAGWGSEAVIQPYDSPKGRFYRVQVRVGATLKEARRQERVFAEAGFPDAFVVAR